MNLFDRLPGGKRAPADLEQGLIRRLPLIALVGTAVPFCCLIVVRIAAAWAGSDAAARVAMTIEVALASLTILYWTIVFTGAFGRLIAVGATAPNASATRARRAEACGACGAVGGKLVNAKGGCVAWVKNASGGAS
jgi:hypothetical protein